MKDFQLSHVFKSLMLFTLFLFAISFSCVNSVNAEGSDGHQIDQVESNTPSVDAAYHIDMVDYVKPVNETQEWNIDSSDFTTFDWSPTYTSDRYKWNKVESHTSYKPWLIQNCTKPMILYGRGITERPKEEPEKEYIC